nr:RNA methyltransferase [Saprospiraceae bacterium]
MKISPKRKARIEEAVARRQFDLTVVLEHITDGHNIGAILRSCESVGITSVYVIPHPDSEMRRNFILGKRTTAGSRKWLDVYHYEDIESCFLHLRENYERIYCTSLSEGAVSVFDCDLSGSTAIVVGNEKVGVSPEAEELSDGNIHIPMQGMVQSLNVSVATSVILFEAMRQRLSKGLYDTDKGSESTQRKALLAEYFQRHKEHYVGRKPKSPE